MNKEVRRALTGALLAATIASIPDNPPISRIHALTFSTESPDTYLPCSRWEATIMMRRYELLQCTDAGAIEDANIELLEQLITRSSIISTQAREAYASAFQNVRRADHEQLVNWRLLRANDIEKSEVAGDGTGQFLAHITIPKRQQYMADVLDADAHELHHLSEAYQRLKDGQRLEPPGNEELYAEYYGYLIGYVAKSQGYETQRSYIPRLEGSGISPNPVVGYIHQKGYGPESKLWEYIHKMQDRHWLKYLLDRQEGQKLDDFDKKHNAELGRKIRSMAQEYENYPPEGSDEEKVIKEIIRNGWVSPDYFPK